MIFQDNVIKEYLKNVYFITGTACAGKSTVSRELGKRHGLFVYDADERFASHRNMSDAAVQTAMNRTFRDADEFFGRTVEEYRNWLIGSSREHLDFVLLDLIRLSQDQKILCDCDLTVAQADLLTEPSRILFLIREPSRIMDDYCNRPDHQDFNRFLHSATDPEKAASVCRATLQSLHEPIYRDIKNSSYLWIERTDTSTIEDTLRKAEAHFGFTSESPL